TMPVLFDAALPIDAALPDLTAALRAHNAAVLVAPPGAGKTTRVPLVLAQEPWADGKKIIVLEPRRLAARAAAARMAAPLGEALVIESVGRAFAVETRYLGRDPRAAIEREVAEAVVRALRAERGSVLAFLPGAAEIRRAEMLLRERIADPTVDIVPLYGTLDA